MSPAGLLYQANAGSADQQLLFEKTWLSPPNPYEKLLSLKSTMRRTLVAPVKFASDRSKTTIRASWDPLPSLPYRPCSHHQHIQNRQKAARRGEKCCSCVYCTRRSWPALRARHLRADVRRLRSDPVLDR